MSPELQQRLSRITLLLLDVDGVLTDGKLYYGSDNTEFKAFNIQDGLGIKLLQKSGIEVGIITGRQSEPVARRARELGISRVIQGREDKWQALQESLQQQPFSPDSIAFMGDDWPDLSVMCRVGAALTVANAHPTVLNRAHWHSSRCGGDGAVREACDLILQAQGRFDALLASYLPDGRH